MAEIVADCPRCAAKQFSFAVKHGRHSSTSYGWQRHFEMYSLCNSCGRGSILKVKQDEPRSSDFLAENEGKLHVFPRGLTSILSVYGHVSLNDRNPIDPPEFLPDNIKKVFEEGARCTAVSCANAAGAMFRLCIDLVTAPLLPESDEGGLNARIRRDLGLRLPWLFDNNKLPEGLRDLATCIKDDGNDAAHRGNLTDADAADLLDFARILLERLYTEPARLDAAARRRSERRTAPVA